MRVKKSAMRAYICFTSLPLMVRIPVISYTSLMPVEIPYSYVAESVHSILGVILCLQRYKDYFFIYNGDEKSEQAKLLSFVI